MGKIRKALLDQLADCKKNAFRIHLDFGDFSAESFLFLLERELKLTSEEKKYLEKSIKK